MFNKYNDSWIASASKDELREAVNNVYDEMCKYRILSPEYNKIADLHSKLVTKMLTNPNGGLPRHQHGWYLPEDDD